jgi:lysozyme
MQPSERLITATKEAEGFRANAYWDPTGACWTCGFGETLNVTQHSTMTEAQASEQLGARLQHFGNEVLKLVKVSLTQGQFDALTDLAYNVGVGNLKSSTLLKLLNAGDYAAAGKEFPRWNRSGGKVLPGLTKRRALEQSWFLEGLTA